VIRVTHVQESYRCVECDQRCGLFSAPPGPLPRDPIKESLGTLGDLFHRPAHAVGTLALLTGIVLLRIDARRVVVGLLRPVAPRARPLGRQQLADEIGHLTQWLGRHGVEASLTLDTGLRQPGIAEHLQVFGHGRLTHTHRVDEIADAALTLLEVTKQGTSGRVGKD
jgi:hypothetical protein